MEVFISWSGNKSKKTALALKKWLPLILDNIEAFVSTTDISAGALWFEELNTALQRSSFGVICLTRENLESTWVMYEAGRLQSHKKRVAVILVDTEIQEVTGPLSLLQLTPLRKDDVLMFIESLCEANDKKMDRIILSKRFDLVWPAFEEELGALSMQWTDYEKAVDRLISKIWHPPNRDDFKPNIIVCVNHGGMILGGLMYYKKGRGHPPIVLTSITQFSDEESIELKVLIPKILNKSFADGIEQRKVEKLRILLVDDSIKSGKSLKSALDLVKNVLPKGVSVDTRMAVIVNYEGSTRKAIEPDYYLDDCRSFVQFPYGPI